jgi:polyisoprenyl-teichoic acid--peptidoglycan teichoic acid transferase
MMVMKKLLTLLISVVVTVSILLVIVAGWAYWKWEPKRHFEHKSHPVLVDNNTSPHPVIVQPKPTPKKEESSFNVLILGIDGKMKEDTRTDVMMLVHVAPMKYHVNILSIPRDTRVRIPDIGYTKINHAHFIGNRKAGNQAGTEAALQAVTTMVGVPIHYFIKVDFGGFQSIIDQIGGIEVELSEKVGNFPKGLNLLNGGDALKLVRERKSLPNGDLGRQDNQTLVLKAIVQKVLHPSQILMLPGLVEQVKTNMMETNFTNEDLLSLALLFKDPEAVKLNSLKVPGRSGKEFDPLVEKELYYWLPDENGVQKIMDEYF